MIFFLPTELESLLHAPPSNFNVVNYTVMVIKFRRYFPLPRKYSKVIGILVCLCLIVTILIITNIIGVLFGIASHELSTGDNDVIASIPKNPPLIPLQDAIRNQVKKYEEGVARNLRITKKEIPTSLGEVNRTCSVGQYKIVFFIRIPKCASTSFVNVLKRLSSEGQFHLTFNPSGAFNWDNSTTLKEAKQIYKESHLSDRKYVYARHFYFVDFTKYGLNDFTYVTIVREPVSRFVSSYHYYHFSSKLHIQAILDPKHRDESLETCLNLGHEGCQRNLMTKYFCGHKTVCKEGSWEALRIAKANIETHFLVVGIMEDMELSYKLIQHLLPDHFRHMNPGSDSQKKQNKNEHATEISQELKEKIEDKNMFDIILYNYIREKLYIQARACSLIKFKQGDNDRT